jgi:hypothetical protein
MDSCPARITWQVWAEGHYSANLGALWAAGRKRFGNDAENPQIPVLAR